MSEDLKDRNASKDILLRDFNIELIEKLKKFTGEKTASKAIKLVCARYLSLDKLCDERNKKIYELDSSLSRINSEIADFVDCLERLKTRSSSQRGRGVNYEYKRVGR